MQIINYRHLDPHGVPNRAHRDRSGAPCDPQTTYQPHYSFSANRLLRYLVLVTSKPSRLMSCLSLEYGYSRTYVSQLGVARERRLLMLEMVSK